MHILECSMYKMYTLENNIQKRHYIVEIALQKCVYYRKMHFRKCVLREIHSKMLMNFHEKITNWYGNVEKVTEYWKK